MRWRPSSVWWMTGKRSSPYLRARSGQSRGRQWAWMSIFSMSGDVRLRIRLHVVARGAGIEMAAGLAGAQRLAAVEGLEHPEEILLDVLEVEELLVEAGIALDAEPHQAVVLVRQAAALDHQPDRAFGALRRVRHARRQQEGFAGADRDVAHLALVLDAQHHLSFQLVEPLRS